MLLAIFFSGVLERKDVADAREAAKSEVDMGHCHSPALSPRAHQPSTVPGLQTENHSDPGSLLRSSGKVKKQ